MIAGSLPESDLKDVAPEELSAIPGIQEVLGLHQVAQLADSGDWDYVVVDCASTADALRMLTLPSAFALYLERAWPRHRRLSIAPGDAQSVAVVELLERTAAGLEGLSAMIADTDGEVGAHLVLTAERVVAAEAVRTLTALALLGVQVRELIVNQVLVQDDSYEYRNLPAHPAFDWYTERIAEQQSVLDELGAGTGDVGLVLVPHLASFTDAHPEVELEVVLSIPFLGEKVGIHRWGAVIAGFLGILVIAFLILAVGLPLIYQGRAYPGVIVHGVAIGGKSKPAVAGGFGREKHQSVAIPGFRPRNNATPAFISD